MTNKRTPRQPVRRARPAGARPLRQDHRSHGTPHGHASPRFGMGKSRSSARDVVGRIIMKAMMAFVMVVATVLITDLPAEAQMENCALRCDWLCRTPHTECAWWTRSCDLGGCSCGHGCKRRLFSAGKCVKCHRP